MSRFWSFLLLALVEALSAPPAWAKMIRVEWKEIPGAASYELQIEKGGKPLKTLTLDDTAWKDDLATGAYSYRVRAIDKFKRPGRWTATRPLVVMPPPPAPAFPKDGASVPVYETEAETLLKWKPTPGVSKYRVEVKRGEEKVLDQTVSGTELRLKAARGGEYSWKVAPVIEAGGSAPQELQGRSWEGATASEARFTIERRVLVPPRLLAPKRRPASASSSAEAESTFEMDSSANFRDGHGYVAVSTMVAPYQYRVVSPTFAPLGRVSARSMTVRFSGEYFWSAWGVGVAVEDTVFQIQKGNFDRGGMELHAKRRFAFGGQGGTRGWVLQPKLGVEARDFVQVSPAAAAGTAPAATFGFLGASLGLDLRRQLSEKVSLGTKLGYFFPLTQRNTEAGATGLVSHPANRRNLSAGVQALYWIAKRWGLGAGAFVEARSIAFDAASSAVNEEIYQDGVFFFGSLVFSFQ